MRVIFWFFVIALLSSVPALAQTPGPGQILVAGRPVPTLRQAIDYVTHDGIIRIGPGVYREGAVLTKDNVRIIAEEGAILDGVAVNNKAALVIKGRNTVIEGLACRNIAVRDKNGACIRMEGENLTLRRVHFYDSEQGLLSTNKPGKIIIEDSRFERLGRAGRAHGIYVNGGELEIRRSFFLSSQDEGHEIKSRAAKTVIEYSVIASLEGRDSRLIDIPDGGYAIIRENLLVEGAKTVNWQLLSFGVEGRKYTNSFIRVEKNLIVTDREGGSELIGLGDDVPTPLMRGNIVVGEIRYDGWTGDNFFFDSRSAANLPSAPDLPNWDPIAEATVARN